MKAAGRIWLGCALGVFAVYTAVAAQQGILTLPPYEDQAVGLWAEAGYLLESGFNYERLRTEEPHFLDGVGGRRSYVINLQPTLIAWCLKISGSTTTTAVLFRLHGFAWASVILASLYVLLRQHLGWHLAALPCLLVAATPAFHVQTEIGGMDLAMTGSVMLSLLALSRQRYALAVLLSALAFALKATAIIVAIALLMYLIARWILGRWTKPLPSTHTGLLIVGCFGLVVAEWSLIQWAALPQVDYASITIKKVLMLLLVWGLCPDIGAVALLVAGGACVATARSVLGRCSVPNDEGSVFDRLRCWVLETPEVLVAWLILAGLLYGILEMMLTPRYLLLAVPLLYLLLGYYYVVLSKRRVIGVTLLGLLLVFNVSNFGGGWLPPTREFAKKTGLHARSPAWMERSSEYRAAHRSDVAAASLLDAQYADAVVVAWFPHSYFLRWPALGYVSRPLDVRDLGKDLPTAHANFMSIVSEVWQANPPRELLMMTMEHRATNLPWPESDAEFVYLDDCPSRLAVYRLPPSLESKAAASDWYIDGVARGITDPYVRILFLAGVGKIDGARALLRERLKQNPQDERARQILTQLSSQ